jgi:hypothetical protein
MPEIEHASAVIRAFVAPERQERLLGLLASARGRARLRVGLAHFGGLDPRYVVPIPAGEQSPEAIARLLRQRSAPATCVLLAEDSALDGRELPLEEALRRVVGHGMGAFASCLPGRLAYFEGEGPRERCILSRAGV